MRREGWGALAAAALFWVCAGVGQKLPSAPAPLSSAMRMGPLLSGRWRIIQQRQPERRIAANLLARNADLAGIRQWRWLTFVPPRTLVLSDGSHTATLHYAMEGGTIELAPSGQHLDHDDWQIMFTDGVLFMRALADDATLVLARDAVPLPLPGR